MIIYRSFHTANAQFHVFFAISNAVYLCFNNLMQISETTHLFLKYCISINDELVAISTGYFLQNDIFDVFFIFGDA